MVAHLWSAPLPLRSASGPSPQPPAHGQVRRLPKGSVTVQGFPYITLPHPNSLRGATSPWPPGLSAAAAVSSAPGGLVHPPGAGSNSSRVEETNLFSKLFSSIPKGIVSFSTNSIPPLKVLWGKSTQVHMRATNKHTPLPPPGILGLRDQFSSRTIIFRGVPIKISFGKFSRTFQIYFHPFKLV